MSVNLPISLNVMVTRKRMAGMFLLFAWKDLNFTWKHLSIKKIMFSKRRLIRICRSLFLLVFSMSIFMNLSPGMKTGFQFIKSV